VSEDDYVQREGIKDLLSKKFLFEVKRNIESKLI
jgi:hypothetical protein